MYGIGVVILFLAIPNYVRRRSGIFAVVIRKIPSRFYCVKAAALCVLCVPFYFVMIEMVESTVRSVNQGIWMKSAGQWLALGLGISTASEAIWHVIKGVYGELIAGKPFCSDTDFLGGNELEIVAARRLTRRKKSDSERGMSTSNSKQLSEEDVALIAIHAEHEQ